MISLNGTEISPTRFPDDTSQVWQLDFDFNKKNVTVDWTFSNEAEFLHIAQLKDLLDANLISAKLIINYLPYGRQDKPITNESTFGLVTFAKLLNTLNFREVVIVDPHSVIALNLIKNSTAKYYEDKIEHILGDMYQFLKDVVGCRPIVCYPDKGAVTKYTEVYSFGQYLNVATFVYGEKVRDQATGQILSYELFGDVKGCPVLIVDDICDGGATFILLADALYKAGASDVRLFVTHGIFSKGLKALHAAGIKKIYDKTGEVVGLEHDTIVAHKTATTSE